MKVKAWKKNESKLVIISIELNDEQELKLISVLKSLKKTIGQFIKDLIGNSINLYTSYILEKSAKLVCQPQKRLNPHMQEGVRTKVNKLLV